MRDCDQNPQILKDLIKRKAKLEQGGDDWDDDEEEEYEEFVEDEELSSRLSSPSRLLFFSPSPPFLPSY